jgi:DNA-binding transcriptional LysR family regulator
MNVELRHLRYFVAVAEELHFGRAAQRLHISQPPLSMQIRALEDAVGAQLLHRTQRRVSLTKAGEVLLAEARQILGRVEHALLLARRAGRGEVGELAIGFISIADYNVLPPLLREFRTRAPDVRLHLRESTSDRQFDDLLAGRIDVGFVLPPVEDPRIAYRPVHREPLVAALPATHRLAGATAALPLIALADLPFVLFPRPLAPGLYDDIVSFCRRAGFSPRVEQEAVQMQTIVSLVSAGIGVSIIPASLRHLQRTGVAYRPLQERSPLTEIGLAWRRDDALATLQVFLDVARATTPEAEVNA